MKKEHRHTQKLSDGSLDAASPPVAVHPWWETDPSLPSQKVQWYGRYAFVVEYPEGPTPFDAAPRNIC